MFGTVFFSFSSLAVGTFHNTSTAYTFADIHLTSYSELFTKHANTSTYTPPQTQFTTRIYTLRCCVCMDAYCVGSKYFVRTLTNFVFFFNSMFSNFSCFSLVNIIFFFCCRTAFLFYSFRFRVEVMLCSQYINLKSRCFDGLWFDVFFLHFLFSVYHTF